MSKAKKLLAVALAVVMAMALAVPAMGEEPESTQPNDTAEFFKGSNTTKETDGITANNTFTYSNDDKGTIIVTLPVLRGHQTDATDIYKIYKVFDATVDSTGTGVAYKLTSGKTGVPTGTDTSGNSFILDSTGNVYLGTFTPNPSGRYVVNGQNGTITSVTSGYPMDSILIGAIATYINDDTPVVTVKTTNKDSSFTITGLDYGYYYITTTSGSVVMINTTKKVANVQDKNHYPHMDKDVLSVTAGAGTVLSDDESAIAQAGSTVTYVTSIEIEPGAMGYVYHDKMDFGLQYKNDLKVYIDTAPDGGEVDGKYTAGTDAEVIAGADTFTSNTTTEGDTFTVSFSDTFLADNIDNKVFIVYSAIVTSNALSQNPAKNTAILNFGRTGSTNVLKDEANVYNAKITVTKVDGSSKALAGAGFVLKNNAGKYYKLTESSGVYTVTWEDNVSDATQYTTTDAPGGNIIAFTGLPNGKYTLIEQTVPAGYNKAADVSVTIYDQDVNQTSLEQNRIIQNTRGSALPSTGGAGLYIVAGVAIVALLGFGGTAMLKRKVNGGE